MDEMEEMFERPERGEGVNFIPCLKWIRRGVAKSQPEKVRLTDEEVIKILQKNQKDVTDLEREEDEEEMSGEESSNQEIETEESETQSKDRDIEKIYNMDSYDDEDDSNAAGFENLAAFVGEDPYLKNGDIDEESDKEDFIIKPTDNLLLLGHVDGNASILEVYVYNDEEDTLYVHHDFFLPSFPMALEWLNYDPTSSERSSLLAIGSMSPIIDVWDLDIVDSLEPAFSLGSKKKKSKKFSKATTHTDAVLALSWNHNVRHLLASGSVDETVLIWDLREGKPARALTEHKEKIQALHWHPFEAQMLLTGCCDQKARVFNCNQLSHKSWDVDGEVEKVLWDHFNPFNFLVATEKGMLHMIDARKDKECLWSVAAHTEGINGISLSSQVPGMLVTGSTNKQMKVWDVSKPQPVCVFEKEVNVGLVHSLEGCPDAPFVFAFGGDNPSHNMHVMDVRESSEVVERFQQTKTNAEPIVTENPSNEETMNAFEQLTVSGGAVGKFKKAEKKKKNKKKHKF